jgi:sugar/nucleoside kinase (ribokinase family)
MVDIFAKLDGEVPPEWGLTASAQHVRGEKFARILSALPPPLVVVSGGGAANVAKIAALLGVVTAFVGAVGPSGDPYDPYTPLFEEELAGAGVFPVLIRDTVPTGLCLILEKRGGERVIAACPQAALRLSAMDVPEDRFREANAVVLDGFLLGRDTLLHRVLDLANQFDIPVAMDVGSVSLAGSRAREIARYCRDYPLILLMNEEEADAFCRTLLEPALSAADAVSAGGKDELNRKPRLRVCANLLKTMTVRGKFPVIVIKRGKRGAVVFAGGCLYSAPAAEVSNAETTGAGDAFCAGFMAGWIQGKPLPECAALGNKTAREVLSTPGVRIDRKKLAHLTALLPGQRQEL